MGFSGSKFIIADDYGLHSSINSAIEELILEGKIHGVSVLVEKISYMDAQRLAVLAKMKDVQLGLHWNITEPLKILNLKKSLTFQWNQFQFLFGIDPHYIDSHHHIHQWPYFSKVFIDTLLSLSSSNLWLRCTKLNQDIFNNSFRKFSLSTQFKCLVMHLAGAHFRYKACRAGFQCNSATWGIYNFNKPEDFNIQHADFKKVKSNDFEILIVHPGVSNPDVPVGVCRFNEFQTLKFDAH